MKYITACTHTYTYILCRQILNIYLKYISQLLALLLKYYYQYNCYNLQYLGSIIIGWWFSVAFIGYDTLNTTLHTRLKATKQLSSPSPCPSPKSKSQIQVPNLSPKFKVQSPDEREWDWGWKYNPTGHHPTWN